MTDDDLAELLADCPTLFHMAASGSWPAIRRHGLLSTSALLDLYGVHGSAREAIEARRRPAGVVLSDPALGTAAIRDQTPLDDAGLRRCLQDGLAPADWYRLLNGRVFFWLSRARLLRLMNARLYRGMAHEVLEVDAAGLVAACRADITLSAINSGSTRPFGAARGLRTFATLADYPYGWWRARRPRRDRVVELAVAGGVTDVARFVRRVVVVRDGVEEGTLYRRDAPA